MKYGFISTQEPFSFGVRIVQIQDTKDGLVDHDNMFFWVEVNDDVTPLTHYYDTGDSQIKAIPAAGQ